MKYLQKKALFCKRSGKGPFVRKKTVLRTDINRVKSSFKVTFFGARGSFPVWGAAYRAYGGHTSCVGVNCQSGSHITGLVFDAGTGIGAYGDRALRCGTRTFHLFLSHMHYDHIIGLMRFAPLFRQDCTIHIYGQSKCGYSLQEIFSNFFRAPFFPVEYNQLPACPNLHFHELTAGSTFQLGQNTITTIGLNHPQGALAYRVWNEDKTKSLVYCTDHEHGSLVDSTLKEFIQNTDLFIYDCTYSLAEYEKYVGWGHSTAAHGAQMAKESCVKKFVIFHHEPESSDKFLDKTMLPEAVKIFKNTILAKETQTILI